MFIRSFRLSDYYGVNRLLSEVLSEDCYEETKDALARQLAWDSELVLVAEAHEEIFGVIIGTIDNDKGYYYRVAVDPSHRGKGIGKSMIRALEQRFNQRDVTSILVAVDEHNEHFLSVFDAVGRFERFLSAGGRVLQIVS